MRKAYSGLFGVDLTDDSSVATLFQRVTKMPLNPEHIVVGAGSTTFIDGLMACIADDGEGAIVPTPLTINMCHDLIANETTTVLRTHSIEYECTCWDRVHRR